MARRMMEVWRDSCEEMALLLEWLELMGKGMASAIRVALGGHIYTHYVVWICG